MHSRRHSIARAARVLLAGALALGSASIAAQVRQPAEAGSGQITFRSDVRMVLHGIAVLDSRGRPVTDLAAHEFQIYENGEPQEIELFLAPNAAPIDVALVLDASSSLAPWGATVRRAAGTFLASLEPRDCTYLLPFNDTVGPGLWARPFDPRVRRRIDALFLDGGTALYDAVYDGLATLDAPGGDPDVAVAPDPARPPEYRGPSDPGLTPARAQAPAHSCGDASAVDAAGQPQRRRAVVLLSDGEDKVSTRRFDEVLDLARRTAIPIFPVVLGSAETNERLHAVLDAFAGNTGGTIVESADPDGLRAAFEDVEAMLRASYLVGYLPRDEGDPGEWHEVEVRTRRPSYRLVHRERYYR